MLRAGAASFWKQGASSIYLFNYDCHDPFPIRGEKRQAIQEIGNPVKLIGKDKHYLITVDINQRAADMPLEWVGFRSEPSEERSKLLRKP